ncbi:MAG: hypothetical protein IPN83_19750, partial [Holophagales bacterium]|nr:hypothetical protein [Holophagales bacterium]
MKDVDPGDTAGLKLEKDHAAELLDKGVEVLADLQDKLYAQDRRALLLVFQAMDAAGKDGRSARRPKSGVNSRRGAASPFLQGPPAEEPDHDFLWRTTKCSPGARADRHLSTAVLRGGPRRRSTPRSSRARGFPPELVTEEGLERALRRRHRLVRALPSRATASRS